MPPAPSLSTTRYLPARMDGVVPTSIRCRVPAYLVGKPCGLQASPHPDRPPNDEGDQEQEYEDLGCVQTRSISVPVPRPPPQHIVTKPTDLSERSSSWSSVVISRAPVEPSGWPIAMAPPFTFTRSMSGSSSRRQAATTEANAS